MMNVDLSIAPFPKVDDLPFEIVERKGIGHPDTLSDAIAERASQYYSRFFWEKYEKLAHHWFDKVMLMGGQSVIEYGHGEIVQPYKVIYAGKAVEKVGPDIVPITEILTKAAQDVLSETLFGFQPDRHLVVDLQLSSYIGPGQKKTRYNPDSKEDLFNPRTGKRVSNDCNVCSGFAPLSVLEGMVLETERYLASEAYKASLRDTGYDIKIVGIRKKAHYALFVNIPFIAMKIISREQYLYRVDAVTRDVEKFIQEKFQRDVTVTVNPEKDSGRSYMTVTGSVADTGDVGVVGRGNRLNGLITPMRPMSIEASSGKNPIDHTGKIYGLLSQRMADQIHARTGIENQVHLTTFKEYPVDQPENILVYAHATDAEIHQDAINEIISENLGSVDRLTQEMIFSKISMW